MVRKKSLRTDRTSELSTGLNRGCPMSPSCVRRAKFVPVGLLRVVIVAAAVVARSNDLRTGPIEAAEIGPMGHSPLPQATEPISSGRYRRTLRPLQEDCPSLLSPRHQSSQSETQISVDFGHKTRQDTEGPADQTAGSQSPTAHNGDAEHKETRRWRDGEMERWRDEEMERWRVLDLIRRLRARFPY